MFGSTLGFTLRLRVVFSSQEGQLGCPSQELITHLVQKAFQNLDWNCFLDKEGTVLNGAPHRLGPIKSREESPALKVTNRVFSFLDPVGHMNRILRDLTDQITWTFSVREDEVIANVRIYVAKDKMGKEEAKEKLATVARALLTEVTRCVQPLAIGMTVSPASEQ
jgi:hypothetical protein